MTEAEQWTVKIREVRPQWTVKIREARPQWTVKIQEAHSQWTVKIRQLPPSTLHFASFPSDRAHAGWYHRTLGQAAFEGDGRYGSQ